MSQNLTTLTSIIVFCLIGIGFVAVMYIMVRILAPRKKAKIKLEPYECGEIIYGNPWVKIHVRYYIFAMLFLIFDVETVFLFPWAYYYGRLGVFGLVEMLIFIVILLLGLVFPWGKGVLSWDFSTKESSINRT